MLVSPLIGGHLLANHVGLSIPQNDSVLTYEKNNARIDNSVEGKEKLKSHLSSQEPKEINETSIKVNSSNLFNDLSQKGTDGKTRVMRMIERGDFQNIRKHFAYISPEQIYNLLIIPDNKENLPLTTAIQQKNTETVKALSEKLTPDQV